jgi:hypothetical protein
MNQSRRSQRRITLSSHLNKLFLLRSILEVLIILPVLPYSGERHGSVATFRWVIVTNPDFGVLGQCEQLAA